MVTWATQEQIQHMEMLVLEANKRTEIAERMQVSLAHLVDLLRQDVMAMASDLTMVKYQASQLHTQLHCDHNWNGNNSSALCMYCGLKRGVR